MTVFDEMLLQVISDKQSGSVAVLQKLIDGIANYFIRESDPEMFLSIIRRRLPLMKGSLGHFAVVSHFLDHLENTTEDLTNVNKSPNLLFDFVKSYDSAWKNVNAKVAEMAIGNIQAEGKTILLHSNSSVILEFFRKLKNENNQVSVIQTESRPENEGRKQAEEIAALGFDVTFVVDSAAAFMVKEADLMITGADQVHPNFYVNKIGTYPLALACRDQDIPVYVMADSRKVSNEKADPETLMNNHKPGSDIWENPPEKITPLNFYFESIPTGLVTKILTERDIIDGSELSQSAVS